MNKSINYRKDHRTTEQFEKDIRCRTNKERFLIEHVFTATTTPRAK